MINWTRERIPLAETVATRTEKISVQEVWSCPRDPKANIYLGGRDGSLADNSALREPGYFAIG